MGALRGGLVGLGSLAGGRGWDSSNTEESVVDPEEESVEEEATAEPTGDEEVVDEAGPELGPLVDDARVAPLPLRVG